MEGCWTSWIWHDCTELSGCKHMLFFKREKWPKCNSEVFRATASVPAGKTASARGLGARPPSIVLGVSPQWVWKAEYWTKNDYCWALRSNKICLVRFWTWLGPITPCFLLISPFSNGTIYASPTNVFWKYLSGFTGSQLERNFVSGRTVPWTSLIPDLQDI